jgi:kumamolisin
MGTQTERIVIIALMLLMLQINLVNAQAIQSIETPTFPAGELIYPDSTAQPAAENVIDIKTNQSLMKVMRPAALVKAGKLQAKTKTVSGPILVRARTNVIFFLPATTTDSPLCASVDGATPNPKCSLFETPQSVACIYGLIKGTQGCDPNDPVLKVQKLAGGQKTIAIVTAYDIPNVRDNFKAFSQYFGLPTGGLEIAYASNPKAGAMPADESGWDVETYLDVEWAHAMAPLARILLVVAKSSAPNDMLAAVTAASKKVEEDGGGEVSLSWSITMENFVKATNWGNHQFELFENFALVRDKVVHVAATGDFPPVGYPASSPHVVAVGGTSIIRDKTSSAFLKEVAWECGGAGPRSDIKTPVYQRLLKLSPALSGRAIADISATSDPRRGVMVYVGDIKDAINKQWLIVGGTSSATPIIAGLINQAGRFYVSGAKQLAALYQKVGGAEFSDVTSGRCGPLPEGNVDCCDPKNKNSACCDSKNPDAKSCSEISISRKYAAEKGWDFCTGVGSPKGLGGL